MVEDTQAEELVAADVTLPPKELLRACGADVEGERGTLLCAPHVSALVNWDVASERTAVARGPCGTRHKNPAQLESSRSTLWTHSPSSARAGCTCSAAAAAAPLSWGPGALTA